ncbi:MAG: PD40 domain-containing protein [Sedimentisphaerales bacterium]|nr:PD40 domain-containing protein [Sedimentisphaerales bacterium]
MESFYANISTFMQWLLKATLQGSILVCLIMLIKLILKEKLSARWYYWLWLVLLIRLALPWAPQSRFSIYSLILNSLPSHQAASSSSIELSNGTDNKPDTFDHIENKEDALETGKSVTLPQMQEGDSEGKNSSPTIIAASGSSSNTKSQYQQKIVFSVHVLPLLWLTGAIILTVYILLRAIRLWHAVISERPVTDQQILESLEDCKMQIQIRTLVGLVITDKISSPALFGFVRPRILLPQGMLETLPLEDLQYVFLHELAHLKRRDIYVAWIICLLQILHWFNPLIWFALRRMRADQEMAADALALTIAGTEESRKYGQTILSLLERFSRPQYLPSLAGILENPSYIERRIQMISKFKSNSYRWSLLAVILIIAIGCMSLPDASSRKATESSQSVSSGKPTVVQTENSNVFIDPNTGIRFTKCKTFFGPDDIIKYNTSLQISPNEKFLLWGVKVIPLDGSIPFKLVEMPNAGRGALSPDGKIVAFYARAIWLIEVDPDSGRPIGSTRKILDGEYLYQAPPRWSLDSKRIIFPKRNNQNNRIEAWELNIENGETSEVTDPFSFGLISPDGKMIATSDSQAIHNVYEDSILVKSVSSGEIIKIDNGTNLFPVTWSANSEWLVYHGNNGVNPRLVRMADRHIVNINSPSAVITQSPKGSRLFCYQSSYEEKWLLKVVSVSGGQPAELGGQMSYLYSFSQYWSLDSKNIIMEGENKGNDWGLWKLPLSGAEPISLKMNLTVPGEILYRQLSPNRDYVFFAVSNDDNTNDLWLAPISCNEMRTTGPAKLVFKNWNHLPGGGSDIPGNWSPDSKRIAIYQRQKGEIWIASVDGSELVQLGKTGEKGPPNWSPDSKMIAFYTTNPTTGLVVQVIPVSGGEAKTIITKANPPSGARGSVTWSPDSKALTLTNAGVISSISIDDRSSQTLVSLKEIDLDTVSVISWSPDGTKMAFEARKGGEPWQIFLFNSQDGHIEKIITDEVSYFFWSPDSKWISYGTEQLVKVRPEGIIWEMDVEEAVAKLKK